MSKYDDASVLQIVDARNVLVVVTRWYGGIHLGPDRFKHINNCTRELLEAHGYIKDKVSRFFASCLRVYSREPSKYFYF